MEPAKPIIGLDSHPTELQLLVLHVDGVLRGYSPAGSSANMSLVYSVQSECCCRALWSVQAAPCAGSDQDCVMTGLND
eukprot:1153766-Pelagomonas_calceolata.AAC.9